MIIINNRDGGTIAIGRNELSMIWKEFIVAGGYDDVAFDDFQRVVFENLHHENEPAETEAGWQFNPIGWEIKVSEGIFKSSVVIALLAIVLKSLNQTNIPLTVLVTIIPLFFEVQKISLNEKERTIYLDLMNKPMTGIHANSPETLYQKYLSEKIRSELNLLDFIEFLEKLSKIGLSEKVLGEKLLIKSAKKFHLHFRIV